MKSRLPLVFVCAIACSGLALTASANEGAEMNGRELIAHVQQLHGSSLADAIVADIDIPRTSRFVLGRHATALDDEILDAFSTRFRDYLFNVISTRTQEVENAEISILNSVDRNVHDCIVSTRVSTPTRAPKTMRWRMIESDGAWRLVDVEFHGVWLAIEQRAQIDALIDRGTPVAELYLAK
jgi:phospholipid transport system substrate-binding protein